VTRGRVTHLKPQTVLEWPNSRFQYIPNPVLLVALAHLAAVLC
jgi:hypothetical protein